MGTGRRGGGGGSRMTAPASARGRGRTVAAAASVRGSSDHVPSRATTTRHALRSRPSGLSLRQSRVKAPPSSCPRRSASRGDTTTAFGARASVRGGTARVGVCGGVWVASAATASVPRPKGSPLTRSSTLSAKSTFGGGRRASRGSKIPPLLQRSASGARKSLDVLPSKRSKMADGVFRSSRPHWRNMRAKAAEAAVGCRAAAALEPAAAPENSSIRAPSRPSLDCAKAAWRALELRSRRREAWARASSSRSERGSPSSATEVSCRRASRRPVRELQKEAKPVPVSLARSPGSWMRRGASARRARRRCAAFELCARRDRAEPAARP